VDARHSVELIAVHRRRETERRAVLSLKQSTTRHARLDDTPPAKGRSGRGSSTSIPRATSTGTRIHSPSGLRTMLIHAVRTSPLGKSSTRSASGTQRSDGIELTLRLACVRVRWWSYVCDGVVPATMGGGTSASKRVRSLGGLYTWAGPVCSNNTEPLR
jgi:hypothetical protein